MPRVARRRRRRRERVLLRRPVARRHAQPHSRSVADARRAISAANRTVDLVLGLGGDPDPAVAAAALPWPAPTFTGVRYSADRATFYGDGPSMLPVNASWHAPIESVVYQGMDWLCPGWTRKLGEQLRAHYGALTAEVAIRHVNPIVQTGDLHVAIYEVAKRVLYVSFSAGSDAPVGAPRKAYDRPYIRFDAAALFAVAPPHSQREGAGQAA
jgi:isopenicillin-N N-acyltransferase like protein